MHESGEMEDGEGTRMNLDSISLQEKMKSLIIYNNKAADPSCNRRIRVWIGYYGRHCADGAGNPYGYILHAAMQKGGR